jgi:hypothetical protein
MLARTERDFFRPEGALRPCFAGVETSKERAITRYPNRYSYGQDLLSQGCLLDQAEKQTQAKPAHCRQPTAYEIERLW